MAVGAGFVTEVRAREFGELLKDLMRVGHGSRPVSEQAVLLGKCHDFDREDGSRVAAIDFESDEIGEDLHFTFVLAAQCAVHARDDVEENAEKDEYRGKDSKEQHPPRKAFSERNAGIGHVGHRRNVFQDGGRAVSPLGD